MSIRQRLAWVLVLFAGSVAVLAASLFWLAEEAVEARALEQLLRSQMAQELGRVAPQPQLSDRLTLQFFMPDRTPGLRLPPSVARLPDGLHRGIAAEGEHYHALVTTLPNQQRAYLLYALRHDRSREQNLLVALLAVLAMTVLGALWLSRRVARRTLQPLAAVVSQIHSLTPGAELPAPQAEELRVIVQTLNDYLRAAAERAARESAFAAAASHELRTPLSVMQGALELIRPSAEQQRAHARLARGIAQARQLLDSLQVFSQRDSVLARQPLALHQQLAEWCAEEPAPRELTVHWQLQAVQLHTAPDALRVIVLNLWRNGLRAAAMGGGNLWVGLSADALTLQDDGPGLPAADIDRLFDPGVKGHHGGSGMGLYIAQTLAGRLNLTLSLQNAPQGGAIATLRWARE